MKSDFKDNLKPNKILDYMIENCNFMTKELKEKNIEIKVFIQLVYSKKSDYIPRWWQTKTNIADIIHN